MNPPSKPPALKSWLSLICACLVGPFFPVMLQPLGGGEIGLRGLAIGLYLWLLIVLIPAVIFGWLITSGKSVPQRLLGLVLIIVAAFLCSLSFGFAACSAIGAMRNHF